MSKRSQCRSRQIELRYSGLGAGTKTIPEQNGNGWQGCCQPLRCYERSGRLVMAVSAAVRTSASVTTAKASTVAIAAAVESSAA